MKNFKVSVVVPAFNEEGNIPRLANELVNVLKQYKSYEIIFINDGSVDNTLDTIKKLRLYNKNIHYISLSRNFGHQFALKAGLDGATGNFVISMDAD